MSVNNLKFTAPRRPIVKLRNFIDVPFACIHKQFHGRSFGEAIEYSYRSDTYLLFQCRGQVVKLRTSRQQAKQQSENYKRFFHANPIYEANFKYYYELSVNIATVKDYYFLEVYISTYFLISLQ